MENLAIILMTSGLTVCLFINLSISKNIRKQVKQAFESKKAKP